MRKVYKTDLGTLVYIGLGIPFFFTVTFFALFIFNDVPLWVKITSPLTSVLGVLFFLAMLKYDVIISDDAISTKTPRLSFLNKYQTMKFEEIEEVYNILTPFPEMPVIFLKSHDKKLMSLMVGFGLPWDALLDVLERLPKDTKINFEPFLWKMIKKPFRNERVKKINIVAAIVILLILTWFLYFLWCVLKLHRVPFPINVLI